MEVESWIRTTTFGRYRKETRDCASSIATVRTGGRCITNQHNPGPLANWTTTRRRNGIGRRRASKSTLLTQCSSLAAQLGAALARQTYALCTLYALSAVCSIVPKQAAARLQKCIALITTRFCSLLLLLPLAVPSSCRRGCCCCRHCCACACCCCRAGGASATRATSAIVGIVPHALHSLPGLQHLQVQSEALRYRHAFDLLHQMRVVQLVSPLQYGLALHRVLRV
mmetsp:Transcript_17183/g.32630  ORF Transcript_17183/g.32630 Transcript_17183/m.32630 type:complete len:226 (+) Transcript_17183:567-1244(+)